MHRIVCLSLVLGLGTFCVSASDTHEAKPAAAVAATPTLAQAHTGTEVQETHEVKGPEKIAEEKLSEKDKATEQQKNLETLQSNLELVRTLRLQKSFVLADKQAEELVGEQIPFEIRRLAILERAYIAQEAGELAKGQAIFNDYMRKFPKDPSVPEVCLRQGLLYRQMGAHQQALSKFYQVMNLALSLNLNELQYYQALVLKAKTEIAETYYLQGKYGDAADYYSRLLKAEEKGLDRAMCHFKLVRSLSAQEKHDLAIAQGQSFIQLYPDSSDVAEVRFMVAGSLKKLGRNRDSMQQVLALLQSQQKQASTHPEVWAYWQQKTGNEIANELYKEGDYLSALEIYMGLAKISTAATWQVPVWYQIGLVYEHLKQPEKAAEMYEQILKRQEEIRGAPTSALMVLLEMAEWRKNYLGWGDKADQSVKKLSLPADAKKTPETAALE